MTRLKRSEEKKANTLAIYRLASAGSSRKPSSRARGALRMPDQCSPKSPTGVATVCSQRVVGHPHRTLVRNLYRAVEAAYAIRHLAGIARIIEPALAIDQKFVAVLASRQRCWGGLPKSLVEGPYRRDRFMQGRVSLSEQGAQQILLNAGGTSAILPFPEGIPMRLSEYIFAQRHPAHCAVFRSAHRDINSYRPVRCRAHHIVSASTAEACRAPGRNKC